MPRKRENVCAELPAIDDVLEESEQILRQCFQEYQPEEVFLSFNGGKDCTVLLDLTINILREIHKTENIEKRLKVVYFRTKDPFVEIEEFVNEMQRRYGVTLMVTEVGEMKATLQRILDRDGQLKACLMGTRRTDPYSQDLRFMQKTDSNWPQVMRVSPLLNWSYHQIWSYIIIRNVPYCSLYDRGYTSIGSTRNTWPNPALAIKDSNGYLSYLPAWRLSDASLERAGRTPPVVNGHASNGHVDNAHGLESNGDTLVA
ncbi:probable FAD synthase [Ostrinia furnacalis]|uniref:probable FAD synthase n=1 Tax=Ostrinia furnacalis TaxID=93504 RepID=UPI00103E8D80|nr:probable FAD synthase [Ostrinia furnacalis]